MHNAILDLADLAILLGRSPQTIKKDLNPGLGPSDA